MRLYSFILRDAETNAWNYDSFSIPQSVLTFPQLDNRYNEFRAFGIINANREVNNDAWSSMKNALLRPHCEAIKNQARSESHREEKESKKRRLNDAKPDGYELPALTSGGKKQRSRKGQSPTEGDPNMPVNEADPAAKA
ncbi:hypothetical protein C0995_007043 [Termitomyces sp. Mi166|nr:hypothetical protein C0995_007043 [Termitomyces sp. Mi166\